MAIVVGRKEVAIGRVANDPHVDPVATTDVLGDDAWHAAKEFFWRAPPGGISDVLVGGISSIAILEDEIPETLWCEVEDLGGSTIPCADRSLVKVVECGGICLPEVSEAEVD